MKLTPTRKHFRNEIGLRRRAGESLETLKASKLPRVAAAIAATAISDRSDCVPVACGRLMTRVLGGGVVWESADLTHAGKAHS